MSELGSACGSHASQATIGLSGNAARLFTSAVHWLELADGASLGALFLALPEGALALEDMMRSHAETYLDRVVWQTVLQSTRYKVARRLTGEWRCGPGDMRDATQVCSHLAISRFAALVALGSRLDDQ